MEISKDKILEINHEIGLGEYGIKVANRYKLSLDFIVDECTKGKNVCEIGPGGIIAYISTYSQANTYAIVNPKENHWNNIFIKRNIELIRWDLNSPLHNKNLHEKFDCVIFLETLEHLNRWPEQVIDDIQSILKSDGILFLSTPNLIRLSNRIRMLFGKSPKDPFKYTEKGDHHVREYTSKELLEFFSLDKWNIIDKTYLFPHILSNSLFKSIVKFFGSLIGTIIFIKAKKK